MKTKSLPSNEGRAFQAGPPSSPPPWTGTESWPWAGDLWGSETAGTLLEADLPRPLPESNGDMATVP